MRHSLTRIGHIIITHSKILLQSINHRCFKMLHLFSQWVGSIDLSPNEQADFNLLITGKTWQEQESDMSKIDEQLQSDKLDAIFCVAGGWAGGNAASKGNCLFSNMLNETHLLEMPKIVEAH